MVQRLMSYRQTTLQFRREKRQRKYLEKTIQNIYTDILVQDNIQNQLMKQLKTQYILLQIFLWTSIVMAPFALSGLIKAF